MKRLAVLLTFMISSLLHGAVHEITSVRQVVPFLKANTLVVFDIDNTLARPPQILGSDQWFGWMVRKFEGQGMSNQQAKFQALS